MWQPEYYVRYISLPRSVEGVSLPNDDGSFDIYINLSLTAAGRVKALRHEINHIVGDHFYRDDLNVTEVEAAARTGRLLGVARDIGVQPAVRRVLREFTSLDSLLKFALKNGGL